jgi:hypothetical protein
MSLSLFVRQLPNFSTLSHADKVKHFAWFIHVKRDKDEFQVADIRQCYDELDLDLPSNLARSIDALTEKKPPELLKKAGTYRLHMNVRNLLDGRYGKPDSTLIVEKALSELPARMSNSNERSFLEETLICYQYQAFRATIVMAWNLAYDHLLNWVLSDPTRLATFNQGIPKRNPKKAHIVIRQREDFEDLQEGEVVDVVGNVSGITANMKRLLVEKLGRRNTYAHPSTLQISKPQVDDMITDLVNNIVLRLP